MFNNPNIPPTTTAIIKDFNINFVITQLFENPLSNNPQTMSPTKCFILIEKCYFKEEKSIHVYSKLNVTISKLTIYHNNIQT
ncbi:MAG TPA: hypothetical protein PK190_09395 [Bacteroidia bacterium]|nr:hypothetical protein [Bacteroidia bacterium]